MKNRIWKWYQRHKNTIEAILDISCNLIPGSIVVVSAVKFAHAKIQDETYEKNSKIEEVEALLKELRPIMIDLIEEVEENSDFQKTTSVEDLRFIINSNPDLQKELKHIAPQLSESISKSISHFQKTKIINNCYKIIETVGKGGQGQVFHAKHLIGNHSVALKLFPQKFSQNQKSIQKLQKEYQLLVNKLSHPHIVQYRDIGKDSEQEQYFIVMDFIQGKNLREILIDKKSLSIDEVLQTLMPVAKALDFAHSQNIVHCDLKPENIILRDLDGFVFLTDFGLAHKFSDHELQDSNYIKGSLPYMAPEQYKMQRTGSYTDTWALGVIICEMLCGQHPFQGESYEHYKQIICSKPLEKPKLLDHHHWSTLSLMMNRNTDIRSISAEKALLSLTTKNKRIDAEIKPKNKRPIKHKTRFLKNAAVLIAILFLVLTVRQYKNSHAKENTSRDNQVYIKKVYWHSEDGAPTKLDPIQSATTYANRITAAIYDTLYEYKYLKRAPYELKPNLAEKMPKISPNGLLYTIKIKEGVKFIDDDCFKNRENPEGKGREVVAADFVYSLKRHFDPKNSSQGSWLWRGRIVGLDTWGYNAKRSWSTDYSQEIEGLKAIDKYTIQIKLTKPYPQILYTLAMGFASVVPQEAVEKYGKQLTIHPVGSGPFKLKSFNKTKTVLIKNPTYRKEIFDIYYEGYEEEKHGFTGIKELHGKTLPIVDTVMISFMKQDVARWNSLNKGNEIQFGTIPKNQIDNALVSKKPPKLRDDLAEKFHFDYERESGFVFSVFNMTDPTFGYSNDPKRNEMNKALRKAIRKAFDWQARIDVFYAGIGEPFVGIIPPGISGYSEFPKDSITRDVEGAKKLLKEAGWTAYNLPVFEYPNAASTTATMFFEQVRGWLEQIGYPRYKIKQKEFATFGDLNKAMKERKNLINSYGWGLDYPDAENVMQLFYGPNASPGSNACNFNHPEYNNLFEKAKPMPDCEERTRLYKRMTEILLEECVGMFGFSRTRLKLWNKNTIMYPTREILSNIFKYVDVIPK